MNAGAFGGETWNHVMEVETIDRHGELRRRQANEYRTSYRHVEGPADEWFVAARELADEMIKHFADAMSGVHTTASKEQ